MVQKLLEDRVGQLMRDNGQKVVTAESCTGGLIADRLTNVPGSSEYFFPFLYAILVDLEKVHVRVRIFRKGAGSYDTDQGPNHRSISEPDGIYQKPISGHRGIDFGHHQANAIRWRRCPDQWFRQILCEQQAGTPRAQPGHRGRHDALSPQGRHFQMLR